MTPRPPLSFDPVAEARRQWEARQWHEASPGMAVVTSIMRVQQLYAGQVDQVLRPFELTFSRFEVLRLLAFSRRGALPMGKIGARLQVHPASVTNAIDRLEQQGFVRRTSHPTDGRTTLATVTATGRRVVEQATEALNADVFTDLGLTPAQTAQLFTLLQRIRRTAGDFV